jgi:chromosome segregation ATPase
MTDYTSDLWTILAAALGAVAGAAGRAYGERLRNIERRDISERDLWGEVRMLRTQQESMHEQMQAAQVKCTDQEVKIAILQSENGILRAQYQELSAENKQLRAQYQDLSARYDRLRASHDRLLRGSPPLVTDMHPPEGPDQGPSAVPGGDA